MKAAAKPLEVVGQEKNPSGIAISQRSGVSRSMYQRAIEYAPTIDTTANPQSCLRLNT